MSPWITLEKAHAAATDESGNVQMVFALCLIPGLTMMGAAIDLARARTAQTQMQTLLDAATLAATSEYSATGSATKAEAKLLAYVDAGLAQAGMARAEGSTNTPVGQVTVTNATFDTQTKSISPTMSVKVGTTMLGLAGIKSIEAQAQSGSSVASMSQAVEVSMMIDLTGSMGWTAAGDTSSKISNLRLAGKDFIDILMPAGSAAKAKVAIAPFADYVNAGPYAVTATGLPATGSYTNIVDLAKTKNGPFSGSYSGSFGTNAASQPLGSGAGATTAGATYSNAYCATPTYQTTQTKTDYAWVWINYGNGNNSNNGQGNNSNSNSCNAGHLGNTRDGWQCQLVTAPLGAPVDRNTPGRIDSNNDGAGGYWMQDGRQNGTFVYKFWDDHREDNRYYLPVTTTSTFAGCESAAQPSGQLITCVTERSDVNHYDDDESPASGGYVGPYNKTTSATTNKVNYSSNGKCMVAGRELPSVMPLTNDRTGPYSFFDGLSAASVGGGTPGHLGTAWAWYMLSPKWNSVFTSNQAAAYGEARKVVVLMTDGEYNEQYSNLASAKQALDLCTKMKEAGIEVYTVGFGFPASTKATDSSAEGKAMNVLTQCSSGDNHYYFPYDGTKLRQAFQAIGTAITNSQTDTKVRVTH